MSNRAYAPRDDDAAIDAAIARAATALKGGSVRISPQNVAKRAAMYLNRVSKEYILNRIKRMDQARRNELGLIEKKSRLDLSATRPLRVRRVGSC